MTAAVSGFRLPPPMRPVHGWCVRRAIQTICSPPPRECIRRRARVFVFVRARRPMYSYARVCVLITSVLVCVCACVRVRAFVARVCVRGHAFAGRCVLVFRQPVVEPTTVPSTTTTAAGVELIKGLILRAAHSVYFTLWTFFRARSSSSTTRNFSISELIFSRSSHLPFNPKTCRRSCCSASSSRSSLRLLLRLVSTLIIISFCGK